MSTDQYHVSPTTLDLSKFSGLAQNRVGFGYHHDNFATFWFHAARFIGSQFPESPRRPAEMFAPRGETRCESGCSVILSNRL